MLTRPIHAVTSADGSSSCIFSIASLALCALLATGIWLVNRGSELNLPLPPFQAAQQPIRGKDVPQAMPQGFQVVPVQPARVFGIPKNVEPGPVGRGKRAPIVGNARFPANLRLKPEPDLKTPEGRFDYAMDLYHEGTRGRAIDLLKEIAAMNPSSSVSAKAKAMLAPPELGRKVIDIPPLALATSYSRGRSRLIARLTHADIRTNNFSLVFQVKASENQQGDVTFLWPTGEQGPGTSHFESLYVIDDNGSKLYADPPGFVTPKAVALGLNPIDKIDLSPGEGATLTVTFPMVSPGASSVRVYSSRLNGWQNNWVSGSIELKGGPRDPIPTEEEERPKNGKLQAGKGQSASARVPHRGRTADGPLSGIWRDKKSGLSLRIEDDGSTLDIKLSGRNSLVRQFTANLSRDDKTPDLLEGTAEAKFVHNALAYSRQITAKVNKSGQLELKCPEWPDPYGRAKPKTQTARLVRQGDLPRSRP